MCCRTHLHSVTVGMLTNAAADNDDDDDETTTQWQLCHRTVVWLIEDDGIAVDVFPSLFILLTATDSDSNITVQTEHKQQLL